MTIDDVRVLRERSRASIGSPVHAFHPSIAVDHARADATHSFGCGAEAGRPARELFGDRLGRIADAVDANPAGKLVTGQTPFGCERVAALSAQRRHEIVGKQ